MQPKHGCHVSLLFYRAPAPRPAQVEAVLRDLLRRVESWLEANEGVQPDAEDELALAQTQAFAASSHGVHLERPDWGESPPWTEPSVDLDFEPGLPSAASPAGLPSTASPAGLPSAASPAGLPSAASPAGLPLAASPAGLPSTASPAGVVVLPTRRKARLDGWDLDAEVSVPAHRPGQLEVLCRYVLRPPIALDRIHRLGPELCALKLKPPYRDGTNHVTMSAQTLLGRLASLVWRPRVHALTDAGVLAPHAKRVISRWVRDSPSSHSITKK